MSIIATYLAQAKRLGDCVAAALAGLNTELRTSYSLSRLGERRKRAAADPAGGASVSAAAGDRGGNPGPPRHAAAEEIAVDAEVAADLAADAAEVAGCRALLSGPMRPPSKGGHREGIK